MRYHSHLDKRITASFGDALLASLSPDGGLWMPDSLPEFNATQLIELGILPFAECAARLARYFTDDRFTQDDLLSICRDAYDFDVPMVTATGTRLDPALVEPEDDFFLELFHGPTLAFKDFAARFMGRAASHVMTQSGETRTILVATSGDTGGAIGDAFLHQEGITVFILFPKGGVSTVQEQQLTTIGGGNANVKAISVDGSFDDCQQLVKDAFADTELSKRHKLMSANSINVGRVIPQSFYYLWTSLQAKAAYPDRPVVYSIPSGNLGNLTGGLIAKRMGAPIDRFIIGNNANDPFVDYLKSGVYTPRPSVPTLSNAMDIGRPNNFPRIVELFGHGDVEKGHRNITELCWGASFSDAETERHMRQVYRETGYQLCPHTAVGHMAMKAYMAEDTRELTKITVATAHPAKFADSVERILHEDIVMPDALAASMNRKKRLHIMPPKLESLSDYLAIHA